MQEESVPKDLLLAGMAARLQILDHPEKLSSASAASASLLPRKTYICTIEYGLPGGSEYTAVPLEGIWEELVAQLKVRVSGESRGIRGMSILCAIMRVQIMQRHICWERPTNTAVAQEVLIMCT